MIGKLVFVLLMTYGISNIETVNFSGETMKIDLYTQYSQPWGGQGLHMASDAFPPDKVVELRTNVTVQGEGVPGKPVSYAIRAPNGEKLSATNLTQTDGIAVFKYLLPCPEDCFGQWTVRASVDLAGTEVSDTLYFLVGWLVEVMEVEAPPIAYKSETMGVNVTLTRICMQDPGDIMNILLKCPSGDPVTDNDLLLYITVTDELNQFVATSKLNTAITELSIYDSNEFMDTISEQWMNHSHVILTEYPAMAEIATSKILIPSWSFTGNATIHANLVTSCPGIPYCPQCCGYVWIKRNS